MIYLFNEDKVLKGTIGQNHVVKLDHERELNGIYSVSAEVPVSYTDKDGETNFYDKFITSSFIGFYDMNNRFQLHRIVLIDVEDDMIHVKGIHLFFDEAKAFGVVKEQKFLKRPVHYIVSYLFDPIGWQLASFETSVEISVSFYEKSLLECRNTIIEMTGYEFDMWVDFDGTKVVGKYYGVSERLGGQSGKRFTYGSNLLKVTVEEDYSEIVTAVIGRGADLDEIEKREEQKRKEAERKKIEEQRAKIKAENDAKRKAYESNRKAQLASYDSAVKAWRANRTYLLAQRKKGVKVVIPKKPPYPKAPPKPTYTKLPEFPKEPKKPTVFPPVTESSREDYKRRVEFTNVVWTKPTNPLDKPKGERILVDPVATELYGYRDENLNIIPRTRVVEFTEVEDPAEILRLSYEWLMQNNRPKSVFSAEVSQNEGLKLGDDVHVIYEELDRVVKTRISKVVEHLAGHFLEATFGDIEILKDRKLDTAVAELEKAKQTTDSYITSLKRQFDADFEEKQSAIEEAFDLAYDEAQIKLDEFSNEMDLTIDSAQEDFIDDVETALARAQEDALAAIAEKEVALTNEINDARLDMTTEINTSYNNAVNAAQAKVDAAKSDMTKLITANKQDADSKISTLNTSLGDANSRIDSTNSQVSTLVGDLNQYKSSTNLLLSDMSNVKNAVSSHTADITNLNNQIVLKASKTEVSDAVNALSYESKNLLRDSRNIKTLANNTGLGTPIQNTDKSWTVTPAPGKVVSQYYPLNSNTMTIPKLESGKTYTWSFDIISQNNSTVTIYAMNTTGNRISVPLTAGVKQRVSVSFTATDSASVSLIMTGNIVDNVITYDYMKLETGTKATPYSQAPEDLEAKVTKNTADITVNANEIAKRVLQTDYNALTGQMQTQINTATSTANENKQTIAVINGDIDNIQSWQVAKGTTIQQTADAINQKIWNTDINKATGELQTQINTVSKTSESNTALITTVKGTVDNLDAWKTAKGTLIDQTINAVSTKVWTNDINALSYENRNLLLNSKNAKLFQNNIGLGNAVQNTDKSWTITPDVGKAISVYKFLTGGAMSIPNFASGTNYVIGLDVTADRDCKLTKYVSNTTYNSPPVSLKANVKQRVYVDVIIGTGSSSSALILMLNIADAKLTYDNIKVEQGKTATPYSVAPEDAENTMTEIKQTADSAYLQADAIGKDYVKQSGVIVQSDGVLIGSKKVSGTEMASAISVAPSNVDIITRVMRVTGDMQVAGDIKSLSLSAVYADIANLRTNVLTADSVTATALKVDQALIDKLNVNNLLVNKIVASTVYSDSVKSLSVTAVRGDIAYLKSNIITADSITSTAIQAGAVTAAKLLVDQAFVDKLMANTLLVDQIKAKSMDATRANIGEISTLILKANVITADMIKADGALFDKIFVSDAVVSKLTSKTAFVRDVQAIDIEAIRLRAVDKQSTVNIEGGIISLLRNDGAKIDITLDGISMYNANGSRRFAVNRSTVESAALSTSNSNVYLATDAGFEARVVDRTQLPGDGQINSYRYRPMRALSYHFGYLANGYIGIGGDELRVMSDGLAADDIYRDVRANYYFGEVLENNKGTNIYIRPNSGEVRFTHKGTTNNYRDFRGSIGYIDGVSTNTGTNFYIGMDGELRVTSRGLGQVSGGPYYRDVRAQSFNLSSYVEYKDDIEVWDYDALSVLSEDTTIYQYRFKKDETGRLRRGMVVGDGYNTPVEFINKDGVDSYEMISWCIRAIQQLNDKIKLLEAKNG